MGLHITKDKKVKVVNPPQRLSKKAKSILAHSKPNMEIVKKADSIKFKVID